MTLTSDGPVYPSIKFPRVSALLFALLVVLPANPVRGQQGRSARVASGAQTGSPTVIPFEYQQSLIFIPVEVNGRKARFFLDTGLSGNAINLRLATAQSLTPITKSGRLVALRGAEKQNLQVVPGATLLFANSNVADPETLVMDLSQLERESHLQIDGILGSALFLKHAVEIDYAKCQIVLDPDESLAPSDVVLPIDPRLLPIVSARFGSTESKLHTGRFMIDTGSDGGIAIKSQFAEKYAGDFKGRHPSANGELLAGLDGAIAFDEASLPVFRLGNVLLTQVPVNIFSTSGGAGGRRTDGTIGNAFLSQFVVIVDYPRARLILRR